MLSPELMLEPGLRRPALAPSRSRHIAWRSMPSVWWPWPCQLLGVATSAESIDLDLLALRPARLRGRIVGAGTTFTVRAWRPTAECDVIAGWAAESVMVTILAGRHGRSSWLSLGVGRRRTLLDGALATLGSEAGAIDLR
jgi:hypothetical protein